MANLEGIITMAHHMDMIVDAEGIEEREQQQGLGSGSTLSKAARRPAPNSLVNGAMT
jgi:EAL domain-containing protein (putative c-di-GMP-specific phosphodiesterase class I)